MMVMVQDLSLDIKKGGEREQGEVEVKKGRVVCLGEVVCLGKRINSTKHGWCLGKR